MPDKSMPPTLTPRSATTRAQILTVAERLFAERSIDAVSVNEITLASGQKNRNALQYHFGTKTGLIQALLDKHTPGISARRHQILDHLEKADKISLEDVVAALVLPLAEKAQDTDGGEDYILIAAQLSATNALKYYEPNQPGLNISREERLARQFGIALAAYPKHIIEQRMVLTVSLLFHGLADIVRVSKQSKSGSPLKNFDQMVTRLIEAIAAILSAPYAEEPE